MSDRPTSSHVARLRTVTGIVVLAGVIALVGSAVATGGLGGLGVEPAGSTGPTRALTPSPPDLTGPPAEPSGSSRPSAAVPSASPSLSGGDGAAPTSAVGFRLRRTVVPMGFPLPARSGYRYGDRWRVPRLGEVYDYEEIRGVAPDGTLLRAHDGVDLNVRTGTPVLAAFDGIVIDPATRWRPWDADRYGTVVVIRSTEIPSFGYKAIVAHLSRRRVHIGDTVRRGQVVGWTGRTGNAVGTVPHLHFELRAPFPIPQAWGEIKRLLDVFDPLPSLLGADPNR
jgi:murein DD-endopeptidase MepM/ murein hydrolase activator NlpD